VPPLNYAYATESMSRGLAAGDENEGSRGREVGADLRIGPMADRMRTDLVRARKARILIRALYRTVSPNWAFWGWPPQPHKAIR
jgi:hypothetical protein